MPITSPKICCYNFQKSNQESDTDYAAGLLFAILIVALVIVLIFGFFVGIIFVIQIQMIILSRRIAIIRKKHELVDYEIVDLKTPARN